MIFYSLLPDPSGDDRDGGDGGHGGHGGGFGFGFPGCGPGLGSTDDPPLDDNCQQSLNATICEIFCD